MAALRYRDEHNKLGYLLKPTGSDDYHQIIDFLRASHIRSPELGPLAIQATIDKTPYTITEDSVRSQLQLANDGGIDDLPIAEIYSGMDNLGPLVVALICLSDGRRFNWSIYILRGWIKRQYKVLMFSSKLFANMRLNFEGHPMPLLPAMLLQAQEGEDPNVASFLRTHATDEGPFTNVEDEPLGGSFHMSPLRSTPAPLQVTSLETELKDHKILFKDVVGKLVKKVKAMEVKLQTKKKKMVVTVTVDSNIPPGGASDTPAASTSVPADVPTSANVPTGSPSVPADTPSVAPADEVIIVIERTFTQMEEDRLGGEAAKRLHDEEQAQVDRQRAELQRQRQQEVLPSAMYYTRMAALIKRMKQALAEKLAKERRIRPMTQAQQRAYMRQFVKNQKFEKIRKVQSNIPIQAFSRTLKRTSPVLEEPSSKRQKSTEAPIPSVPKVPQSPVVSSPKSSGTKRKPLDKTRLTKPKSKLIELDSAADDQTFIKVVSNKDSEDEAPSHWSALVGWEVIPTPLGDINALYRIDRSTKNFITLRQILHMVNRQDLVKLYGLVVKYYETILLLVLD
nr:hypothetical protein [Tanacetum cinerariifolium]